MSDKSKGAMFYVAALGVLFYGVVVLIGHKVAWENMTMLLLWTTVYGGLMAGFARYDTKSAQGGTVRG